jgi:hypothetical protein
MVTMALIYYEYIYIKLIDQSEFFQYTSDVGYEITEWSMPVLRNLSTLAAH